MKTQACADHPEPSPAIAHRPVRAGAAVIRSLGGAIRGRDYSRSSTSCGTARRPLAPAAARELSSLAAVWPARAHRLTSLPGCTCCARDHLRDLRSRDAALASRASAAIHPERRGLLVRVASRCGARCSRPSLRRAPSAGRHRIATQCSPPPRLGGSLRGRRASELAVGSILPVTVASGAARAALRVIGARISRRRLSSRSRRPRRSAGPRPRCAVDFVFYINSRSS